MVPTSKVIPCTPHAPVVKILVRFCDPARSCSIHCCILVLVIEYHGASERRFKLQVSLYDTSSQAATIQILHGCLNCARPADRGGIWLGCKLLTTIEFMGPLLCIVVLHCSRPTR